MSSVYWHKKEVEFYYAQIDKHYYAVFIFTQSDQIWSGPKTYLFLYFNTNIIYCFQK